MRAGDRLHLDRGIPPGIEDEDVVGGREVETETAGLETDQEQGRLRIGLELFDHGLSVARGAVEIHVIETKLLDPRAKERQI